MNMQTKIILLAVGSLICMASVMAIHAFFDIRKTITIQLQEDGILLAQILARTTEFTLQIPDEIDGLIGEQMETQAQITAYLVALAEEKLGMTPDEINAMLKELADKTDISEFWITDENGNAYLTNTDQSFKFEDDPKSQPQAYAFRRLLEAADGSVIQKLMPRELDGKPFKYVGVPGVDKPRIVQIGYEARFIEETSKKFDLYSLLQEIKKASDISEIQIWPQRLEQFIISFQPKQKTEDLFLDRDDMELIKEAIKTEKHQERIEHGFFSVAVPLVDHSTPEKKVVGAVFVELFTSGALDVIYDSMLTGVRLFLFSIGIGILVSVYVARTFTGPIEKLEKVVGKLQKGDLSARVNIKSRDEIGSLGKAFNKMAADMQSYTEKIQSATAAKQAIESELGIARKIQMGVLPTEFLDDDVLSLHALSVPAKEVGGDFYDFFWVGSGKRLLGIVIADVSDKGVPAAFFMAQARTVIKCIGREGLEPHHVLDRTNNYLAEKNPSSMFVTTFYGILEPASGRFLYTNAGHNPPFLRKASGKVMSMGRPHGPALGIVEHHRYESNAIQLGEGDVIFLYTDGITEAANRMNEFFGEARLRSLLVNAPSSDPRVIIENVFRNVTRFQGRTPQSDDITMLAARLNVAPHLDKNQNNDRVPSQDGIHIRRRPPTGPLKKKDLKT